MLLLDMSSTSGLSNVYILSLSFVLHGSTLDDMVLIEEITDDSATRLSSSGIRSDDELLQTINQLSARLALPEELLPSFMAEDKRTFPRSLQG